MGRVWVVAGVVAIVLSACVELRNSQSDGAMDTVMVARQIGTVDARVVDALTRSSDWQPRASGWALGGVAAPARAEERWRVAGTSFWMEHVSGAGRAVDGVLVYADEVTPVLVVGAHSGVEVLYVVPGSDAPRRWRWRFEDGALTRDGDAIRVLRPDGASLRLSAPVALDSAGERLPVTLELVTSRLVEIAVETTSESQYPLLVDPILEVVEWRELSDVPTGRRSAAMTFDETRGVTLIHGGVGMPGPLSDLWQWDGTEWTLLSTGVGPGAPDRRFDHVMGNVRRTGGTMIFGGSNGSSPLGDTWVWDGSTWSRSLRTNPPARWNAAVAYDPVRDRVVLFGGATSLTTVLGDTWEWDGTTWAEIAAPRSPPPRGGHAMAWDPEAGRIVLHGGYGPGAPAPRLADVWEWDGTTWTARTTTGSPTLQEHAMANDPVGGGLIVAGGRGAGPANRDALRLVGGTWSRVASVPSPRVSPAATVDSVRGRALFFGGLDETPAISLSGPLAWDGSAWVLESIERSPEARAYAPAAYDSNRDAIFFMGGEEPVTGSTRDDAWEFRAGGFYQMDVAPRPAGRSRHATWFDPVRRRVWVHGGQTRGLELNDLWSWNGSSWAELVAASRPSARSEHAAAFDGLRDRAVVFGGRTDAGALDETWLFDGTRWSNPAPATRPPPRAGHAMTFDARRGVVVVFGGATGVTDLGDTWEWDGTTWRDVTSPGPSARRGHALTYDADRQIVLLVGGATSSGTSFGDAWEWDGTTWRDVTGTPSERPAARSGASVAHQQSRRRIVTFGGTSGAGGLRDTWSRRSYRLLGSDCTLDADCETGVCDGGVCVAVRTDAGAPDASVAADADLRDTNVQDAFLDEPDALALDAAANAPDAPAVVALDAFVPPDAFAVDAAPAADDAFSAPDASVEPPASGCGCRVVRRDGRDWLLMLATLFGLGVRARRRRA